MSIVSDIICWLSGYDFRDEKMGPEQIIKNGVLYDVGDSVAVARGYSNGLNESHLSVLYKTKSRHWFEYIDGRIYPRDEETAKNFLGSIGDVKAYREHFGPIVNYNG